MGQVKSWTPMQDTDSAELDWKKDLLLQKVNWSVGADLCRSRRERRQAGEVRQQEFNSLVKTGEENQVFVLWLAIHGLAAAVTPEYHKDQV